MFDDQFPVPSSKPALVGIMPRLEDAARQGLIEFGACAPYAPSDGNEVTVD